MQETIIFLNLILVLLAIVVFIVNIYLFEYNKSKELYQRSSWIGFGPYGHWQIIFGPIVAGITTTLVFNYIVLNFVYATLISMGTILYGLILIIIFLYWNRNRIFSRKLPSPEDMEN